MTFWVNANRAHFPSVWRVGQRRFDVFANGVVIGRIFNSVHHRSGKLGCGRSCSSITKTARQRTAMTRCDGRIREELAARLSCLSQLARSWARSAPRTLWLQKHACYVAAGWAFIPDQSWLTCERRNPHHLVHFGFASRACQVRAS
jgi:hypothetical protein